MPSVEAIILAAGKGTRMKSSLPKVLHQIGGKSILQHVVDTVAALGVTKLHIIVGHKAEEVKAAIRVDDLESVNWCTQSEQLGTGHAVQQAIPHLSQNSKALILNGDIPLISTESLSDLINLDSRFSLMTATLEDPTGLGRIIRSDDGAIQNIVEERDATPAQKSIAEINTNFMCIEATDLSEFIHQLKSNNDQEEYYLTDVVALAADKGLEISACNPLQEHEILGVNSKSELAQLERIYQKIQAQKLMHSGVTVLDPNRIDIRGTSEFGRDCCIDVNVVLEGTNQIGDNCVIGPNCILKNVVMGDNCRIESHSVLEQTTIGNHCTIGPFARIRPETELGDSVKIGNFVETKKSSLGNETKVNHLSYVGDSTVGERVNIGAGVITCNYDGANKHQTIIGDDVFVGSDSQLVAPVSIASGSTIGAGSTITTQVEQDTLAVSRARQRNIAGWKRPQKSSS